MTNQHGSYAAYFNVARHNVLLALNAIALKSGLSAIDNDDQVAAHPVLNQLKTWAKTEADDKAISDSDIRRAKQVVAGLQRALPILGAAFIQDISGQNIKRTYKPTSDKRGQAHAPKEKSSRTWRMEDLSWALDILLKTLVEQRNYYSHAYQEPATIPEPLIHLLGLWFDAGRRKVRSRFEYAESEVQHLIRTQKGCSTIDLKAIHALVRSDNDALFSDKGAAFFCCLFLDKQQGNEFLSQFSGFKCERGRLHQATLRTYLHWSIRLPFVRIDTDSTPQSLALDIFNELARCPVELYEQLSSKDQKHFEIQPSTDSLESTVAEDDEGLATRFIRHSDRFIPLMMECLDHFASADPNLDTGIRFQLDMGDFYFAAYPKRLPDGSSDVRRLKQKILRFGALPTAVQQAAHKPQGWCELEPVNAERDYDKPYIVQAKPHYHLQKDGSIPIKLKQGCTDSLYAEPQPDAEKTGRYLALPAERPDFWLSPYELAGLVFYQHLRTKHGLPSEYINICNLLEQYKRCLRRLFQDMHDNHAGWCNLNDDALDRKLSEYSPKTNLDIIYTLRRQDLPADLLALLQSQGQAPEPQTVALQKARNTLRILLTDGEQRLADVRRVKSALKDRIKPGKLHHRVLRAGEMATYLAKDIVRLQPAQDEDSAHKGKPTSIMADLLQARLAYFGRDKTSLPALFTSLRITGNDIPDRNHPFLSEIRVDAAGMNGIAQFYEAYLHKRQTHLKALEAELTSNPAALQTLPTMRWLKAAQTLKRLQGNNTLQAMASRYSQSLVSGEPLNLPRGLFRELTVQALLSLGRPRLTQTLQHYLVQEAERKRFTSLSVLVELYFAYGQEEGQGDASQDFYYHELHGLQEQQRALDAAQEHATSLSAHARTRLEPQKQRAQHRTNTTLTDSDLAIRRKRLDNKIHNLDRTLTRLATQDQLLMLAAKQLINLNESNKKGKNPASDTSNISLFANVKLQTLQRDDLNDMVPHEVRIHNKTLYADAVSAKKIGKFKALARDRRLPGLLHYYEAERIHASVVAYELQAYPRAQKQAFGAVLEFEKSVNSEKKLQASALPPDSSLHRKLMQQHLRSCALPPEQSHTLQAEALTLRNAFCHNQIPSPNDVKDKAARGMLDTAKNNLAPARQTAQDIANIQNGTEGQSVAQYFADTLITRYQELDQRPQPRQPQQQKHQPSKVRKVP
jgi:hypothetical protein